MTAYLIFSFDVSDPEGHAEYVPGSVPVIMQTIRKHGGKVLVAGPGAQWIEGERKALTMIEFPSVEAAHAFESDPDYQPARAIRLATTGNRIEVIAAQFVPPSD